MSKAFNKVWYEGLILKLKSRGISDALLNFIESLLENSFKEFFQMVRHQSGYQLRQVFHKHLF